MDGDIETVLLEVSEFQRSRYFGKYRGLVTDIEDPDGLGRIRAEVPAVMSEAITSWAMPCLPFAGPSHGLVTIPELGDGVWIEFEAGDLSRPIWTGFWWGDGQRPEPSSNTARHLTTSAGHQVLIDEEADEIKLIHPGGAELKLSGDEILLSIGQCSLKLTSSEININEGMAKITTAGASLVNDAFKVGG